MIGGGFGALSGIATTGSSIISDTMRAAAVVQDLVMLPVRFVASLQPLRDRAHQAIDMLTDESIGLAELQHELVTKNINNITKFTLLAALGAGGTMVLCFLGAVIALVLGLSVIPVFWGLLLLLLVETRKTTPSGHSNRAPVLGGSVPGSPLSSGRSSPSIEANISR